MYCKFEIAEKHKMKFARLVSTISHAPVLSIPAFVAINYFLLDFDEFLRISFICVLFAAILPIVAVLVWSIKFKKVDIDVPEKEDRIYPLIIVIVTYFIGSIILYVLNAPPLTTLLMFCYCSNTLVVFFINIFWKISIHSMGVAGPTTALIFAFGPIGSIFGLIIPIVMWSRVYLKRHTMSQVISGALLGFMLTAIQIYVGFSIYNINIDIYPVMLLMYAFIAPSIVLSITGFLNRKGMHDGYTRKIFHFIGFVSIAVFLRYAPFDATIMFIIVGIIYVGIACISSNGFLWFDGISRKSDSPNEILYVILPMASAILGLGVSWMAFGHPFVETGMLCVAIGDAVAEPIGVRFGKHKYKVYSLTGYPTERSLEGSLSVLLSCAAIIFFAINNLILALLLGILISLIEAISPRGLDNFTVLIGTSLGLAMIGTI
ncbi:MAG: phosphatase PAP2 family protein [Euryarchaeota archaeon]|nr:phosphatase PAP2 family protein [Euryarchaeota archaeon]